MSDLGALLRKAREQRGYTLEDIQEYTKIRKRYLEAIETGEYKVLPGSFYVRAFVKTYAETVGLDAEEVLRLYQKELPQPPSTESVKVEPRMKPSRRSVQHNDRWGKFAVSLLMWAFPILIAAVIYIYLSNNKDAGTKELNPNPPITSDTTTPSPTSSIVPSGTPIETATPPPPVSTATLTLKETKNSINYYDVSVGAGHQLIVNVTGDCWIEVRENNKKGKVLYTKSIKEPIKLNFELTAPIYVNVGRTDHVEISVEDAIVDDGNKPGSSKYIFTPPSGTTDTAQ
ncbi:helix-turn-helix domain-containing protein [Cohnella endophytica]|uniref:Helix-turn-helix domain-containing protein n=1 Tax=Cohnella endophytica TaxID=2419778 RepID=A0A494XY77_9BACL|nr:RodZ domain-containing protein [Cohnella endophytica]RKP55524.1 helix-turn-helix domain-containing protein [Cohnella endophytica]